jgi:hypothetical protein
VTHRRDCAVELQLPQGKHRRRLHHDAGPSSPKTRRTFEDFEFYARSL